MAVRVYDRRSFLRTAASVVSGGAVLGTIGCGGKTDGGTSPAEDAGGGAEGASGSGTTEGTNGSDER